MRHSHGWLLALAMLSIPLKSPAESGKDLLVVVHPNTPFSSIDFDLLKGCFLKKRLITLGEIALVPINAPMGSASRKVFQKLVLTMQQDEEIKYWQDQMIKSGVEPPVESETPLKVIRTYFKAIAYVFRDQFKEGLGKIVATIPAK